MRRRRQCHGFPPVSNISMAAELLSQVLHLRNLQFHVQPE